MARFSNRQCSVVTALLVLSCGEAGEGMDSAGAPSGSGPTGFVPGPAMTIGPDGTLVPVTTPVGPGSPNGPVVGTPETGPSTSTPTGSGPVPVGSVPPGTGPDTPTPTTPGTQMDCSAVDPGIAPLRRLTRFEYNNTVKDLLLDDTSPGNALPPELLGNGYGNDGDEQPVSSFLAEQYGVVAEDIVERASLAEQFPCVAAVNLDGALTDEASCARSIVEDFGARAYRRDLESADVDELVALYDELRVNGTFEEAIQSLLVAILQSPDFLYRFEWGIADSANSALRRPSGAEMATRLSYFFWGTQPDDELREAAASGALLTNDGIKAQAERLLADQEKARPVVRYFFDHFLPINTVTELVRDKEQYPTFSNDIGALMHEETQGFLENEIFNGTGTWTSVLTAPYVYVNEELAAYYGIPGVTGPEFRKVDVDPSSKRMGLLTQGAILAGTTITNFTNPVRRGGFIIRELMCQDIQLPTDPDVLANVKPPEPFIPGVSSEVGRETGRMRYEAHRELDSVCITCHAVLDPPGFALENFDAVGLWRDQENGVSIDATGDIPLLGGAFDGPMELAQNLAQTRQIYSCFASNWGEFAYGRKVSARETSDACLVQDLNTAFESSGYNIKELLVALTQTDAFLYLPQPEGAE